MRLSDAPETGLTRAWAEGNADVVKGPAIASIQHMRQKAVRQLGLEPG
jgi:hypothetical protein